MEEAVLTQFPTATNITEKDGQANVRFNLGQSGWYLGTVAGGKLINWWVDLESQV